MELIARYRGSLLGLAVGDALGAPLEFKQRESFEPIKDISAGGVFQLNSGEWTDDTSMALCLAESLIENRGFLASDQMDRYLKWYHQGYMSSKGWCFDIGTTTRKALLAFENHTELYKGLEAESTSNGSLMRVAPIALAYANNPNKMLELAKESSRITHINKECLDACRYLCALISGALLDIDKKDLLETVYVPEKDCFKHEPLCESILSVAKGSFRKEPPEIAAKTEASKTLEAALWAFNKTDNFADGALLAVNLGEDADTVGAVYGQLAGAYYGEADIPESWVQTIVMGDKIRRFAEKLFALSMTM